ncbi:MAG TPA: EAL domain-containing protein [Methylotenera sp.]|nr:EAL domain-containing protein [Methylotenera sp.]
MNISKTNQYLWIVLTGCIFVGELIIMWILHALPALSPWLESFVDATLLSIFVAVLMYIFVFRNMKKTAADKFKAEEQLRLISVAFEMQEAIMITDANANILRVNRAFEKITGYSEHEVIGKNPSILSSGLHDHAFYAKLWSDLLNHGIWKGEMWDRGKNGEIYSKIATISAVKNDKNETVQYIAAFTDNTAHKKAENEIYRLAFYDALTGLPNRRLLLDRLSVALSASTRNQQYGALIFLDLDNFKTLNDTLGHYYGDMLLVEVAKRLKVTVREMDTVARLGGDEFVVLLEDLDADLQEASRKVAQIAEKLRVKIATPYQLNENTRHSSPSIGVCMFYRNQVSVDDLLKYADMAMYQAKNAGRNRVRFFDPHMQQVVETRALMEADLRSAITDKQLSLFYQVQLDQTMQPVGAEALLRWQHPTRGFVSPVDFIQIAEESSLILEIGDWVLETACRELARWSQHEKTRHLVLAINISAQQFMQTDFVEHVAEAVKAHQINPACLKLELTESVALGGLDVVVTKMLALKHGIGVTLSLDDFGTGYSSLSYLKKLPFNQIKIDRSFVRDMLTDTSDAMMVKNIIDMTHNFGMQVIAEGVETEQQLALLREYGCLSYQGYLFSKPLPVEEFEMLLNKDAVGRV